ANRNAVPERDRRHTAREVLREVVLIARENRGAPLVRVAQHLVQRRLARDRDADERRLERERDERRDGQAGTAAVELRDDDRDPGRPSTEKRALISDLLLHGPRLSAGDR